MGEKKRKAVATTTWLWRGGSFRGTLSYQRLASLLKHGAHLAETLALKRQISPPARMARETMAAIE